MIVKKRMLFIEQQNVNLLKSKIVILTRIIFYFLKFYYIMHIDEILSSRPPFIPSKKKPNDLLKSDRMLFLNSNPNDQYANENKVSSSYKNKFGLTKSDTVLTVKKLNKAVDSVSFKY